MKAEKWVKGATQGTVYSEDKTGLVARINFSFKEANEAEANTNLIAAAPELLEALKYAEEKISDSDYFESRASVLVTIRRAIAKAEGRAENHE